MNGHEPAARWRVCYVHGIRQNASFTGVVLAGRGQQEKIQVGTLLPAKPGHELACAERYIQVVVLPFDALKTIYFYCSSFLDFNGLGDQCRHWDGVDDLIALRYLYRAIVLTGFCPVGHAHCGTEHLLAVGRNTPRKRLKGDPIRYVSFNCCTDVVPLLVCEEDELVCDLIIIGSKSINFLQRAVCARV